jgi:thioredoxin reductase
MAIDTPARLAVLGSGPIGLEAALYARFLGYDVELLESGDVAESVRRWGHVRMFSRFGLNRSPLALAALEAQADVNIPGDDELLTGHEYRERFLLPLSESDLLSPVLKTHHRVEAIGRPGLLKGDSPGHEDRGDDEFRLLVRNLKTNEQSVVVVDAVLDATGTYQTPNWVGLGGMPALGESALADRVTYHNPDILGDDRERFAGAKTLVVGCGYSAATAIVALAELKKSEPQTQIVWVSRRSGKPLKVIADDPLPERANLVEQANAIAADATQCDFRQQRGVHAITKADNNRLTVSLMDPEGSMSELEDLEVDHILALVGYRPDLALTRELQIHQCYASEGPMRLAAQLLKSSGDCLAQTSHGAESLLHPEPHYWVLGAKSYGRNPAFLISIGLEQIREAFSIIGDRADLNLYQSIRRSTMR